MYPTEEKIKELKAKHPERSIHQVEAVDPTGDQEEVIAVFVMTGPSRDEYKKFLDEMQKAENLAPKDKMDSLAGMRGAIERAALAQIRWPDRDETQRIFDRYPGMVDGFQAQIQKAFGESIEVRSKKL